MLTCDLGCSWLSVVLLVWYFVEFRCLGDLVRGFCWLLSLDLPVHNRILEELRYNSQGLSDFSGLWLMWIGWT